MPSTVGEVNLTLPADARTRFTSLDAWRKTLNSTAEAYAVEVQRAVAGVLGALAQFEEGWRLICQEVLDGRTGQAHSERDHFLRTFQEWHLLLAEARDLARFAERVTQRSLPEAAQAESEAAALEARLKKLSARWQTAEDLEDIVAEGLAPSAEKLEAVRRKHGYPQAWYDDDSKPF